MRALLATCGSGSQRLPQSRCNERSHPSKVLGCSGSALRGAHSLRVVERSRNGGLETSQFDFQVIYSSPSRSPDLLPRLRTLAACRRYQKQPPSRGNRRSAKTHDWKERGRARGGLIQACAAFLHKRCARDKILWLPGFSGLGRTSSGGRLRMVISRPSDGLGIGDTALTSRGGRAVQCRRGSW